jgi:hypothetical protein
MVRDAAGRPVCGARPHRPRASGSIREVSALNEDDDKGTDETGRAKACRPSQQLDQSSSLRPRQQAGAGGADHGEVPQEDAALWLRKACQLRFAGTDSHSSHWVSPLDDLRLRRPQRR